MRSGWRSAAACAVGLFVACWPAVLLAAGCDENNPAGPSRAARITLTGRDATGQNRDELRTFVETGSLGRVDVAVASQAPRGVVRAVSAAPRLSRFSRDYGEALKGIAIAVRLNGANGAAGRAIVVLSLRQVCAQYFRDTFLYE